MNWTTSTEYEMPGAREAMDRLTQQTRDALRDTRLNVIRQYLGREPEPGDKDRIVITVQEGVWDREQIAIDGLLLGEIRWGMVYDEARQANYWRVDFTPTSTSPTR